MLSFEKGLTFTNKINVATTVESAVEAESSAFVFDFDESDEYENRYEFHSDPSSHFMLNIGEDKCSRFGCACHKNNIAVRLAIKSHPVLSRVLAKLSSYAATVKNSINLYKLNISKKARLRIECPTRWSSSFLMLEAFQRAYIAEAFPIEKPCPVLCQ
jgi:hypothetical protein